MRLLAVRHGQASAGSDDYDRLSALGTEQSRRLGQWLASASIKPRRVLLGAMRRHQQTLDALLDGYGAPLPDAEYLDDLNEFDHDAVLAGFCRRHADHPAASIAAAPWQAEPREVGRLVNAALGAWSSGSLDDEHAVEPWSQFRQRVGRAVDLLHADPDSGLVLMVSSGGVLTQLLMAALEAPDTRAAELNLGIRNSAVCEFVRNDGRLRLLSWNGLPHLADAPEMWTHY
ncbi:MAG: histidine phosphatase family protein [Lysobacteraceae bacterium]